MHLYLTKKKALQFVCMRAKYLLLVVEFIGNLLRYAEAKPQNYFLCFGFFTAISVLLIDGVTLLA